MLICAKIKYKISRKFEGLQGSRNVAFQEWIWTRRKFAKRNLYRKHPWKSQEYYLVNYFL